MAFFDELKKNLSGVSDTVAKTSETMMKKSGHVMEIQKAKLKKVSLESDMKNLYAVLGKLYFEKYADGDLPEDMAALCKKITACQHAITEAEQRVAFLKGVVICSNCQAEVDKDALYCPKCGAEIVRVVEDEDIVESVEEEYEEDDTEAAEDIGNVETAAAETEEVEADVEIETAAEPVKEENVPSAETEEELSEEEE